MVNAVTLQINSEAFTVSLGSGNHHTIKEDDFLSFLIEVDDPSEPPLIFIEDTEMQLTLAPQGALFIFQTQTQRYFSECFGQAFSRIYVGKDIFSVFFNVRAKKASAEQAAKMISYLGSHHESLIKSCFSRSTMPVGTTEEDIADPESIISSAEDYVNSLLTHRSELMATKRERLVPTRQPIWKSNRINCDIDPIDILSNLDAISPTTPNGDLVLWGRHFAIGDIDVSTLQATADVPENQILLGGLYSIRTKLQFLLNGLDQRALSPIETDGYESFERLLLKITSAGMVIRCYNLMDKTAELIRFFESRMGIKYAGEIRPTMTPYARTSKVYRTLYACLANWYAIGAPSFGANNFLMKLRSLSKIYELYSLFHLIEYLLTTGWEGHNVKFHPTLGSYVPAEITLLKGRLTATVSYESIIHPLHKGTHDKALVDVVHRRYGLPFNYWNPDFVVRIDSDRGKTRYLILDAKYSVEYTVRQIHIPAILEKYFWGMAVYDMTRDALSNNEIAGVIAIYPLGVNEKFIPHGKRASVGGQRLPLPVIGGIGLAVDQPQPFASSLQEILDEVEATIL